MEPLTATECHLTYGIIQCYLPPDTSERAPPNPSRAGWYSIYLPRRDGRLSWPSWLDSAPAGSRTSALRSRVGRRTAAPPIMWLNLRVSYHYRSPPPKKSGHWHPQDAGYGGEAWERLQSGRICLIEAINKVTNWYWGSRELPANPRLSGKWKWLLVCVTMAPRGVRWNGETCRVVKQCDSRR